MMNDKIKTWVNALRSGEFKQTRRTLQDQDGFCCLGVYAVVNKLPGYRTMYALSELDEGPSDIYQMIHAEVPSQVVDQGVAMNDTGKSFREIADMIEGYYNRQGV